MKKTIAFVFSFVFIIIVSSSKIMSKADSVSGVGQVNITSGYLNIRISESTAYSPVGRLEKNSYISLISKSNGWWKIKYGDSSYGYCSSNYITEIQSSYTAYVMLTSGHLNVRSGPSTSYPIQNTLTNNTQVQILSTSSGWANIVYNGSSSGWVSNSYLSTDSQAQTYSAVNLNVASYKQTDTRWSNVYVGNTSYTIGKIGCATTCVAMKESYQTSSSITPAYVAKNYSYSSSGAIYWPTSYTISTSSSNYLNTIYSSLKNGKPVILGCKKANGSQHWVVVTGYVGGSTLSTSYFTINDPGSNSRTRLNEFLSEYPIFYKILF